VEIVKIGVAHPEQYHQNIHHFPEQLILCRKNAPNIVARGLG
jgi:hypothetical protein